MGAMIYVVIRNKGWLGDLSMRQVLVMAAFSLYFGFTSQVWIMPLMLEG